MSEAAGAAAAAAGPQPPGVGAVLQAYQQQQQQRQAAVQQQQPWQIAYGAAQLAPPPLQSTAVPTRLPQQPPAIDAPLSLRLLARLTQGAHGGQLVRLHPLLRPLCCVLDSWSLLLAQLGLSPQLRLPAEAVVEAAAWLLQLGPDTQAVLATRPLEVALVVAAVACAHSQYIQELKLAVELTAGLAQHIAAQQGATRQAQGSPQAHGTPAAAPAGLSATDMHAGLLARCWEQVQRQQPGAAPQPPAHIDQGAPAVEQLGRAAGQQQQQQQHAAALPSAAVVAATPLERRLLLLLRADPGAAARLESFLEAGRAEELAAETNTRDAAAAARPAWVEEAERRLQRMQELLAAVRET